MSEPAPISYAQFGHNFILQVVSAQRIRREVDGLLESSIQGVVKKLPADLVVVEYHFALEDVRVEPLMNRLPDVSFQLYIDGSIRLDANVVGVNLNFTVKVTVRIEIDVRTYAPLFINLSLLPIRGDAVDIQVDSHGVPEEVLSSLNIIRPLVRSEVVDEVNRRIESPEMLSAVTIDVLKIAEAAAFTGAAKAS